VIDPQLTTRAEALGMAMQEFMRAYNAIDGDEILALRGALNEVRSLIHTDAAITGRAQ
jgi:hypothetical protein